MDEGIELQPNNLQLVIQNFEPPSLADVPQIEEPAEAAGNENGAVLSNREWLNRFAEERKQKLAAAFGGFQDEYPMDTLAGDEPENLTKLSWNDLISLAIENENFADFRHQPKEFWQRVRQMSETINVEVNGNKPQMTSRYNEFLKEMQVKKLSPPEYAKTLPPNQRAVFLANFQIEKTFGANIFENGAVTLSENGQARVLEFLSNGDTRGKIIFVEKNPTAFAPDAVASINSKAITIENATSQNASLEITSQPAPAAVNLLKTEGSAPRTSANTNSESATVAGGISRRDAGASIGGALINGAFASIDVYQNLENKEIGSSHAIGNNFGETGNGFAAGATGAMFGAAVGGVIPGAGTDVSGILGFVSGVVVGIEVNEGLRWLGADKTISGASSQIHLTAGNSFTPNSNFQLVLA